MNSSVEAHHIGQMDLPCERGCGAMRFLFESTKFICCDKQGHGSHESLTDLLPFIETLLQEQTFQKNIRHYNCTFQIATLGSTLGTEAFNVSSTFRLTSGSMEHCIILYPL